MRKSLLLILILPFVIVIPSINLAAEENQEKTRILIIPLKARSGISQDEAHILTDILSVEIHKSGKFIILNRDDMKAILTEKEFETAIGCEDNICLLENVEKLAVNKIIAGSIGSVGGKYFISIRLINDSGQNEIMEKESCDCPLKELDKSIEKITYKFLGYLDEKDKIVATPRLKSKVQSFEDMIFIKGGCFDMGDIFGDGDMRENPVHEVCVDDFYIGVSEVTQGQWVEIMGNNPSFFNGCVDCPVEQVSWNDVQEFIRKLNQKTGLNYRLPTEAEWEYAAREGGKKIKWAGTNDKRELEKYAWYERNSKDKTHPVKTRKPNELGLYDMTGNVWEWVQDWYDEDYYKNSPRHNPRGPSSGSLRVFRGGTWYYIPKYMRVSYRKGFSPDVRYYGLGFRLAMTP
ncbi:MAG: SUMF1/EgtB/PvdO family nonheme iron enzyme [Candidatus Scalinduaceae bacterium]